ncbi:MAG: hypothetical protein AB8G11_06130 [Saprospiraceae bacterium]
MNYKELVAKAFEYATVTPLTYTQLELVEKFAQYGFLFSKPTMSNLYRQKEKVSFKTWKMAATAFQRLLEEECGMSYDETIGDFVKTLENITTPADLHLQKNPIVSRPPVVFHARGRLQISEKAAFVSTAKQEVIEIGVGLRTFTSYFFNHAHYEYQAYVETLLSKGVNIKCLLIEPKAVTSEVYLNDRSESVLLERISESIVKLNELKQIFDHKNYKGQFNIYTYSHIPYSHFCVVDANTPNGKMIISPYIFGVKRADAPVFELSKQEHHYLFDRYWQSIQLILKNSEIAK